MTARGFALALALFLVASGCSYEQNPTMLDQIGASRHRAEIEEWHAGRVEQLTSPSGWLAVSGLHWLRAGDQTIGSKGEVRLPDSVSPRLGIIQLSGSAVRFIADPDAGVLDAEGERVIAAALRSDTDPDGPTILRTGSVTFFPIVRGGRIAIRVRDSESSERKSFQGIERYPVSLAWRKPARFEAYATPKQIPIQNIVGTVETMEAPGAFVFEHEGREFQLDGVIEAGSEELFIMFADATSGNGTYGAGRYMYAAQPLEGETAILDFNKAYNPPCAFTRYATCPLPPRQNRLPFAVTAGEKDAALHGS